MKKNWDHIEGNRVMVGAGATPRRMLCGQFIFKGQKQNEQIEVLADNGMETGWEHVSVKGRIIKGKNSKTIVPGWYAMAQVKELFWEPYETVIQYHPAETEYVNCHPDVLHLWRPKLAQIPVPPKTLV